MNILFVTVGTSAIYNPDIGKAPNGLDNKALRADVGHYKNVKGFPPGRFGLLKKRLCDAHKAYWAQDTKYRGDQQHFLETSAELVSTMAVRGALGGRIDQVVLLHSATDEGRFAAGINYDMLEPLVAPARVLSDEVVGLEAHVIDTIKPLRKIFNERCPIGDERVILNFTGGFKGLIPSLTIIAESKCWKMFYLHESLNKPVWVRVSNGEVVESSQP